MQRLIFESSPLYLIVCVAAGLGYAWLLYSQRHPWSVTINRWLFVLRTVVVTLIAILLLGPILKLTLNTEEKPAVVVLLDNSASMAGANEVAQWKTRLTDLKDKLTQKDYSVEVMTLDQSGIDSLSFKASTSDLNGALRAAVNAYDGRNLAGLVLVSDGIYNSGFSPLYSSWRVPVYTVGVGDTIEHADLILKNVAYNKIAYQGNQFPVRAEVIAQRMENREVSVAVYRNNELIQEQTKNTGTKSTLFFDFQVDAKDKGIQRLDVVIKAQPGESNVNNNRASAYVEVVEGKKKILVIAPSPHPDLKALRAVVEKNPNNQFVLHIPGVTKTDPSLLQPGQAELVIFHTPLDVDGRTVGLMQTLTKSKSSVLYIIGRSTNLRALPGGSVPLTFAGVAQVDLATPAVNPNFAEFTLPEKASSLFSFYPPVQVPWGKFTYPTQAHVLLYQRIGSVITDRPMMLTWDDSGHKSGALIGEGFWQWRMEEFSRTEKTEIFDETFGKMIQFLSTSEDKRKFRFFPIANEFTEDGLATFEGQVYNDLFEKVYGNRVDITLRDASGKSASYNYVISPGGERYSVGGLKEGVYFYQASAVVLGKAETVTGQFVVRQQHIEAQNRVADFGLLRKLAKETDGKFYSVTRWDQLAENLSARSVPRLIHTSESFRPLVNSHWLFVFLLLFISAEWFLRKYLGSY